MADSGMDEDLDFSFSPSGVIYPARAIRLDTVTQGGCYVGTANAMCVGVTPQQSENAPGLIGNNTYPYVLAAPPGSDVYPPGSPSRVAVYGPMRRALIDIDPAYVGTIAPNTLVISSTNGYGTAANLSSGSNQWIIGISLSFATAGQSCNIKIVIFPYLPTGTAGSPFFAANTAVTTSVGTTLTGAAIAGGVITRTGPTAAFTDTTDPAANSIGAVTNPTIGQSWILYIKNLTAYTETLSAGSNVTLSGQTVLPGNSTGTFLVTYSAANTVTIQGISVDVQSSIVPEANTAVSNAAGTTLAAAGIVGRLITRSGTSANFTDTTDTGTSIQAAIPNASIGQSFELRIRNTTAYQQTISGGSGVTVSNITVIPPLSVALYLVTLTATNTVTMFGIETGLLVQPLQQSIGSLTTNGAGTITAATIAAGILNRTVPTSAFTDTTDTAANIIAAVPNATTGYTWLFTYQNNTPVSATIAGGSSVTVSGNLLVGAGCWVTYLVTITSGTTVTMAAVNAGPNFNGLPNAQLTTGTTTTTFAAGQLTGAAFTVYTSTATTPGSIATRTATQMFGDIPNAFVGMNWVVRIINNSSGANTLTLTAGTNVTLSGKTTYATTQYGFMDFLCTFTSATAMNMQFIGAGVGTSN